MTNSCTATSTTNAHVSRSYHTALWSGNEIIVLGGLSLGFPGTLDTGGRYDPGANSWTAPSTANPPPARRFHTAVWIGNQMIVWGGAEHPQTFNTAGNSSPPSPSSHLGTPLHPTPCHN